MHKKCESPPFSHTRRVFLGGVTKHSRFGIYVTKNTFTDLSTFLLIFLKFVCVYPLVGGTDHLKSSVQILFFFSFFPFPSGSHPFVKTHDRFLTSPKPRPRYLCVSLKKKYAHFFLNADMIHNKNKQESKMRTGIIG